MYFNIADSLLWPCLPSAHDIPTLSWNRECFLCRLGGTIILLISIICFIFNIRYLIWYRQRRHRNTLVLSLFLASLLVLTISVPSVLQQLFTCQRHCNEFFCVLEGFISYLCGCLCMLIYMILSINRYILLRHRDQQWFCHYSTTFTWILCTGWTLPPVFKYWSSYVPEGLGFHCSIKWNDNSQISRLYILCSFMGVYFIPLIILFVVNLRVHRIIRNISLHQSLYYSSQQIKSSLTNRREHTSQKEFDYQSNTIACHIQRAADRKRLRIEYRFIQAIIYLVGAYVFAWTPYAIIAILQILHVEFIFHYGVFITLSAFIAKLSVVLSPLIYLNIMNVRLLKKLFFQK